MGFIKVDSTKTDSTHQVMDGTYEVVIKSAGWSRTSKNTEYVSVKTVVRNDVVQNEQGEDIEHPLWKSKPDNVKPSDVMGIPAWKFQQIAVAAGLPDGTILDTIDDWRRAVTDKPIRITMKQDDQGRAKVTRVEPSLFPEMSVGFTAVDTSEELPF